MTWIIVLFIAMFGGDPDGVGIDYMGGDPDGVGIEQQMDHVPNSTWGDIKKHFS